MIKCCKKINKKIKTQNNVIYVFIDAANLWDIVKSKKRFIDFEKLNKFVKKNFKASFVKFLYYACYPAEGTREYNLDGKHKFFTFLKKGLDFEVKKKKLKRIKDGGVIKEKGDMDVWITLDAVHHSDKYNVAFFFTGDSDFLPLVSYLKKQGKGVFIFSSKNSISKELKTGSDGYVDLLNIPIIWGKELRHRKGKK